jgi:hypothetical protein
MIALYLAAAALLALALMIVVEILRLRASSRKLPIRVSKHPRRQPLLEDRIRNAFAAPVGQYGEIFISFMIWKRERETRLELYTGDPWQQLNEFTRSIVVRHLWRALERLANGSVVIVDSPPQRWSKDIDDRFDDQGIDPWGTAVAANGVPQFIKDR